MKLLIHDYNNEEWSKVATNYEGWKIISDDGNIRPCIGCFGCWLKTPGQCVIKDGYDQMGKLIHEADEVLIIVERRILSGAGDTVFEDIAA